MMTASMKHVKSANGRPVTVDRANMAFQGRVAGQGSVRYFAEGPEDTNPDFIRGWNEVGTFENMSLAEAVAYAKTLVF